MMAHPTDFIGANLIMRAPPGRDDVGDLVAFRNRGMVVSCWRFDDAEWAEVERSRLVWLSILGGTMPPVFVGSESETRNITAEFGPLPKQRESK